MKKLRMPPVLRLSLGLSLITMTILLGVEMLGVLPSPEQVTMDSRKKICESLAVNAVMAIQENNFAAIQTTMEILIQRNQDIIATALRNNNGTILAEAGDHQHHWNNTDKTISTLQNVQVPIFISYKRWGTFEVCFKAMHTNAVYSMWNRPMIKVIGLSIPLAFLCFFFLIKKTLRHLDPTAVVPERVKRTLDSLVEGVVLMDEHERIVLANKAFEKTVGDAREKYIGKKASELNWTSPQTGKLAEVFPWQQAIRKGVNQPSVPLVKHQSGNKVHTFMVNGAPIIDGKGKIRGALATFDDVTHIEAQNSKLQKMLNALKKSRDEIRRQNRALQILATQDPLTGCLNRRAFFERFEAEFSRARRYGHDIVCMMLDIDHFKRINDAHGHQVGDKVLQKVSHIVRSCLRDSDVVCRYGGEEFCLILTETNALGGLKSSERIRRAISAEALFGIQVTISIGVSASEFAPSNPSELLSQADKSLYNAKNGGRNRSVVYSEVLNSLPQGSTGDQDTIDSEKQRRDAHIPQHVVKALMLALEHRDVPTAEHSRKVGDLCAAAAQGLMSINECSVIEIAGLLHDIGKLGVPDAILLKPGPLTDDEWETMHDHERRSVDVIESTFVSHELAAIVRYHGHWYDGSKAEGDDQPKGKEIPLGARILNIADAFDAIVSNRPYRAARSYEEAFEELRRCAGKQFDPDLVEHFIKVVNARDDSRREDKSMVSDSVKLEIGREIENLLVSVNTFTWKDVALTAGNLTTLADKYGLDQIASVAKKIETASAEKVDQMEIMNLTTKLLGVSGPLRSIHYGEADDNNTLAA